MRIAYYLHWHQGPESGVFKKVTMQTESWIKQGHDVKLFVFTRLGSSLDNDVNKESQIIEVEAYTSFLSRFRHAVHLTDRIKDYAPDIVYFRLSGFYPTFLKLTKLFPFVLEINSDDVSEFRYASLIKRLHNSLSRYFLLKNCRGIVFVSGELSKLRYFKKYEKPFTVIGNAINLSLYKLSSAPDNARPVLVFIGSNLGAVYKNEWNGIDKILWLARKIPEYDFYLIGIEQVSGATENVHCAGFLNRDAYQSILEKADVGIGTLALHRKNMQEASALKVREYLACGLPVIIGYEDTDLSNTLPFILKLGNYEENVRDSVQKIKEFVEQWKGRRIDRKLISKIDTGVKEKKRLNFFNTLIDKAGR